MNLLNKILKALYVALANTIIYSFLLLPLSLWINAIDFLASQYNKKKVIQRYLASEMKVLSWLTLFFNSLIFLSYIFGILLIISLFFKDMSFDEIKGKFVFLFLISYFAPIILSFIKEIISLQLLTYFKLENIENNTSPNE